MILARNTVLIELVNSTSIQQPDDLLKTLIFIVTKHCNENSIQSWTAMIWIENLLSIHLLRSISATLPGFLLIFNDPFQLFKCKICWWGTTPVLPNIITMVGNAQRRIWTQSICRIYSILFTQLQLTLILILISFPLTSTSSTLSDSPDYRNVYVY